MGFRFRKSFGKGPFRVTVSKSGVGYSVGGKGFRVTKKAGGGMRTTASIPGTGISYVKDYSSKKPDAVVPISNSVSNSPPVESATPSVERREDNKYRYCSFCLKAIPEDVDVCPYCKKSQTTGKSAKSRSKKTGWIWVILIAFLLANCNPSKSEENSNTEDGRISKAVAIVKTAVGSVFHHYEVSYEDNVISAIFWEDGLAPLTDKAIAGDESSLEKWNELVSTIEDFSLNVANELEDSGITDIPVLMMLVDDRNTDMVLVAAAGGGSFSNRVALATNDANISTAETASIQEAASMILIPLIEQKVSNSFHDSGISYSVYYQDGSIVFNMWKEGVLQTCLFAIEGNHNCKQSWDNLVDSLNDVSIELVQMLNESKIENLTIEANILNDQNTDNALLCIVNDNIVYNFVEAEIAAISRSDSQDFSYTEHQTTYVLNNHTMKFHYPTCSSASEIKNGNKSSFTGTRAEVIAKGYSPCGHCDP